MAQLTPDRLAAFVWITLMTAFAGATLDIAVDAYRVEIAPNTSQGALVATYSLGYRIALIVTGALALVLADHVARGNDRGERARMTQVVPVPSRKRLAMILSGGGARGAYEVGVLWYVFDELARLRGAAPRIDVLSGTSVGAINACFLAAHLLDPMLGIRRLVDLWSEIEITRVLGFGFRQVVSLPRIALGGGADSHGLGLAFVKTVALRAGGDVRAFNRAGGFRIEISLPAIAGDRGA